MHVKQSFTSCRVLSGLVVSLPAGGDSELVSVGGDELYEVADHAAAEVLVVERRLWRSVEKDRDSVDDLSMKLLCRRVRHRLRAPQPCTISIVDAFRRVA